MYLIHKSLALAASKHMVSLFECHVTFSCSLWKHHFPPPGECHFEHWVVLPNKVLITLEKFILFVNDIANVFSSAPLDYFLTTFWLLHPYSFLYWVLNNTKLIRKVFGNLFIFCVLWHHVPCWSRHLRVFHVTNTWSDWLLNIRCSMTANEIVYTDGKRTKLPKSGLRAIKHIWIRTEFIRHANLLPLSCKLVWLVPQNIFKQT